MSFSIEVFPAHLYPQKAAARIAAELPDVTTVALTGGTTAEKIYRPFPETGVTFGGKEVFFSDERCVPPDDDASNFAMATRSLGRALWGASIHRMRGEDDPADAAAAYSEELRSAGTGRLDLLLVGMGADCHVCAMFPGSPALDERNDLCAAIDRPDGMKGLTLTPPTVLEAGRVLLLVSGEAKAEAVARVVNGDDPVASAPARMLADHPDVTFLLDEAAASHL
ncbi:MAG: 6-phosphogluconolactonase [Actinomycetota bacterium]|nr:6-phosphogluconolactonase [Actinomycetota bacterium]